jgi:hypothetical protein
VGSCPPLRSYRCVALGRSIQSSRVSRGRVLRCRRALRWSSEQEQPEEEEEEPEDEEED